MAYALPNGMITSFSTAFSEPLTLKEITNADPAIAVVDGDKKMAVDDVWYAQDTELHGLRYRVGVIGPLLDGNKVTLRGINTTNTRIFETGFGTTTTVRVVTAWQSFAESTEVSTSGGEQQYYTLSILEDPTGNSRQVPTYKTPRVIHFKEIYDPNTAWFQAAEKISSIGEPVVLRMRFRNGNITYLSGYLSLNVMPSIASNTPMDNIVTFSAQSEPTLIKVSA